MDNVAVILIIILAVAYISRHFYKKAVRKDAGTCGCSSASCDSADASRGTKKPLSCCKE